MKYNQNVIDFFKKHNMYDEKTFEYLQDNSLMIDYKDPDQRCFIGCFYVQDMNDILLRLQVNTPYVYDEENP